MIHVRRAKPEDLPGIQELMGKYGKMTVAPDLINHRDIHVIAKDTDTGATVGFLWCGLMARNTVGYIDKFTVDPTYSGKGVGNLLANHAFTQASRLGVREVLGVIKRDDWHENSAMNALKMAFSADSGSYTLVRANIGFMKSELKKKGV